MVKRFSKTDRRILNFAVALLLAMLYLLYDDSLLLPSDDSNSPGVAQISNTKNDVRRKNSQHYVWRTARKKDSLHMGDSVFAGQGSNVTLEFKDGRKITLQENSLIVISLDKNQLQLELKYGRFSGQLAKETQLTVKGKRIELKDETRPVEIDSENIIPNRLTWIQGPPPQFYHKNHHIPLALTWESAQPAGRYRLQFSSTADFKKIIHQETVFKTVLQTSKYPDNGKYFVRIEAQQSNSKVPSYTEAAEINIVDMAPPTVTSPQNQQVLTFKANEAGKFDIPPRVSVQWHYGKKSPQFEIQISNHPDFSSVQWTSNSAEQKIEALGLAPGKYFVRVRDTTSVLNKDLLWSDSISFQIEYQFINLNAPQLLTKKIDYSAPSQENIIFKWNPVEKAHQYIVEIAKTSDFVNKQTFSTTETNFIYKNYVPGQSYFRVFSSSRSGYVGKPSETGRLSVNVKRPVLDSVEPRLVLGKSPEDPGDPQDFNLSWSDLKIADSYMLEVSRDPQFQRGKKFPSLTTKTKITIREPGQYYARVKGLNKSGEAITSYSEPLPLNYKLRVPLSTPKLIEPLNQMTLFFQKNASPYLWLEWKPVRQALTYQVEVAQDPNFNKKILAVTTSSHRYLIKESLPPGLLYWRIRALGEVEQISNWSSPHLMTVYTGKAPRNRLPASRRR